MISIHRLGQMIAARFGPLEEVPYGRLTEKEKSEIQSKYVAKLSNIKVDGKSIGGLGNSEASWHSDMTYLDVPPPCSILLGVEIPHTGGNTYFSDQRAAYDSMPANLRNRIVKLTIKHDASHTSVGQLRRGFEPFDDPRDAPGAIHPVVKVHEETGDAVLHPGRREWAYITGLPLHESEALLDEIWSYASQPEYVWKQEWQPFDVIVWDNRRVLHRRDDFPEDSRRLMKRCQVLARTESDN